MCISKLGSMDITQFLKNSKLKLTEAEEQQILPVFDALLKSFEPIMALNLADTAPLISVSGVQNALREDVVAQTTPRETLLEGAPETHNGYFVVPKTVD